MTEAAYPNRRTISEEQIRSQGGYHREDGLWLPLEEIDRYTGVTWEDKTEEEIIASGGTYDSVGIWRTADEYLNSPVRDEDPDYREYLVSYGGWQEEDIHRYESPNDPKPTFDPILGWIDPEPRDSINNDQPIENSSINENDPNDDNAETIEKTPEPIDQPTESSEETPKSAAEESSKQTEYISNQEFPWVKPTSQEIYNHQGYLDENRQWITALDYFASPEYVIPGVEEIVYSNGYADKNGDWISLWEYSNGRPIAEVLAENLSETERNQLKDENGFWTTEPKERTLLWKKPAKDQILKDGGFFTPLKDWRPYWDADAFEDEILLDQQIVDSHWSREYWAAQSNNPDQLLTITSPSLTKEKESIQQLVTPQPTITEELDPNSKEIDLIYLESPPSIMPDEGTDEYELLIKEIGGVIPEEFNYKSHIAATRRPKDYPDWLNPVVDIDDRWVDPSKLNTSKTFEKELEEYEFFRRSDGSIEIKTEEGFDDITGIPKLQFADKAVSAIAEIEATFDQVKAKDDVTGKMFRVYNAAFNRFPDSDGLEYWIEKNGSGENTERQVAESFLASNEFKEKYGEDISNEQYVTTLYQNILDREPDADGYNYWVGQLNNGIEDRSELLLGFAESTENQTLFSEVTGLY